MPHLSAARRGALALLALALVAAGCSDDGGDDDAAASDTSTTEAAGEAPACDQGATGDLGEVTPVEGVDSDLTITSFDGTEIRAHWFPADGADAEPVPTILMGPGWSQPGAVESGGVDLFGALDIGDLNDAGYNVLTWDPRGFGESTGVVTVNAADAEGRDAQVLLDWVSEQPEALTDAEGDPRAGMVGASYGGGIQLTLGGIDCRVDALVPSLAWHSLETSLYKAETVKAGWGGFLTQAGDGAGELDPHILSANEAGTTTGTLSAEDREWFLARGPGELVDEITAPTLFVQGTVDTLFTLDEAITNYRSLQERGVPTAMLWFCGGHGSCLTDEPDLDWVSDATFAWLARYLKGDESAVLGPTFTSVDQDGDRWTGDDLPADADGAVEATGDGRVLTLTADGGSGPLAEAPSDTLGPIAMGITPAPATNAVELEIPVDAEALVLGAPHVTLEYSGTVPDGPEPTRLFAQIVDEESGTVVGTQVTPIAVTLDGTTQTVEADLEVIAHEVDPDSRLVLQIVATTVAYATPRLGGEVTFTSIDVSLPTTEALTPA